MGPKRLMRKLKDREVLSKTWHPSLTAFLSLSQNTAILLNNSLGIRAGSYWGNFWHTEYWAPPWSLVKKKKQKNNTLNSKHDSSLDLACNSLKATSIHINFLGSLNLWLSMALSYDKTIHSLYTLTQNWKNGTFLYCSIFSNVPCHCLFQSFTQPISESLLCTIQYAGAWDM